MGIQSEHALGSRQKLFVAQQTVLGTAVAVAATDAMRIMGASFQRKRDRKERDDTRQTRDLLERYNGRVECAWEVEKKILASGVAGTAPDDRDLWIAGVGPETVVGGTSVTYGLNSSQSPIPLTMVHHMPDVFMARGIGCLVDDVKVSLSGTGDASVVYSGPCRDIQRMGGVINFAGGMSSGAGSGGAGTGEGRRTFIGARVQFDGNSGTRLTNSGAGYTVAGIVNDTISWTPNLEAAVPADGDMYPFTPSETVAGSPIDGILGSLSVDGSALAIKSCEYTIANNLLLDNDRYGSALLEDATKSRRVVTGQFVMRGRRDMFHYLVDVEQFAARSVVLVVGATAGSILTVTFATAELDTGEIEVPKGHDGEECTLTIPFYARGTGAGENSVSHAFT